MAEQRWRRGRKGGRHSPPTSAAPTAPATRTGTQRPTAAEQAELEGVFASIMRGAPEHLGDKVTPLAVEAWASELWSICQRSDLGDLDPEAVFAGGLISYASARRSPASLSVLRSLAAVVPEPYRSRAAQAADRMAANGVAEPAWAKGVRRASPTAAWLSHDPVHDDGVSVMVGFDGPAGHDVVGLYVDHNLGGVAKDAFVIAGNVDEVVSALSSSTTASGVEFRPIGLAEAASRWRQALALTDAAVAAPTTADVHHLRALIETRLDSLPPEPDHSGHPDHSDGLVTDGLVTDGLGVVTGIDDGLGGDGDPDGVLQDERRSRILDEFLRSDDVTEMCGPPGAHNYDHSAATIEYLASQVMAFSFDHVLGATLRFSPVMVEVFCLNWAPRRIAAGQDTFALLPDVLVAWIRFAGKRRGIPAQAIDEAVAAAHEHRQAMMDLARDPSSWGPAKMMAMTIIEHGIDVTDPEAVEAFVDDVNRNGGIDSLATLFGRSGPSQFRRN